MIYRGQARVYVVEVHFDEWNDPDRWEACSAASTTYQGAFALMKEWRARNAGTKVRIARYMRDLPDGLMEKVRALCTTAQDASYWAADFSGDLGHPSDFLLNKLHALDEALAALYAAAPGLKGLSNA